MCGCYLQFLLQHGHSVCVLAAPHLLPPSQALSQTGQHTLLTALQLMQTHTLLVAHTLQVDDLHKANKTHSGIVDCLSASPV